MPVSKHCTSLVSLPVTNHICLIQNVNGHLKYILNTCSMMRLSTLLKFFSVLLSENTHYYLKLTGTKMVATENTLCVCVCVCWGEGGEEADISLSSLCACSVNNASFNLLFCNI